MKSLTGGPFVSDTEMWQIKMEMRASVKVFHICCAFHFFGLCSDNEIYPQDGVRPCPVLSETFIYSGNGIRSIRFVHLKKKKSNEGTFSFF